jgi:hypothetical protein
VSVMSRPAPHLALLALAALVYRRPHVSRPTG